MIKIPSQNEHCIKLDVQTAQKVADLNKKQVSFEHRGVVFVVDHKTVWQHRMYEVIDLHVENQTRSKVFLL